MLCIASALGMNAQTWPADAIGEGYYALYNVGAEAYLQHGNAWGSQASYSATNPMIVELKAVGNNYFIRTAYGDDAWGLETLAAAGDIYTDQSRGKQATWTFTQVATDNGPVYNIVSANNHGGGAGSYLTASSSATTVVDGSDGTSAHAKWKLMKITDGAYKNNLIAAMANATESSPVDATLLIADAQFGAAGNIPYEFWTMEASNRNLHGGNVTNPCAESFHSNFTLSQTFSVPNGYYKLSAQGFYRNDGTNTNLPYFYLNDKKVNFLEKAGSENNMDDASASFTAGQYTVSTDIVTVTGNSITVGAKLENNPSLWCIWDNFKLQYLGPIDLSAYKNALDDAVATAQAVQGTIPTAAFNQIQAVITQYNKTYTTEEGYATAIEAINNAVATYASDAIVAAYSHYKAVKTATEALDDDHSVFTGNTTVNVASANTAVENATTVDGINSAIAMIRTAAANFLGAVTVNENKYFNITNIFLNNADFSAGNINGWETNYVSGQQAQNIGYQGASYSNTYTEGEGDDAVTITATISQFIEAWRWSPALGDGYLRQTVSGLPEGKYTLECDAIAADQPGGTMPTGAYVYINAAGVDYKTTMATENEKPKHFTAQFLSPGSVDVTFGMKTESTTANWIGADNFTVKFYGVDLSGYVTMLAEAVSEAQALQGNIPTTAYTELNSVVTANNKTWSTSAQYTTAIANIQEATATAKALQASYTRYKDIRTAVLAAAPNTNVSNANSQANAATTNEGIEAAIVTLRAALITALPNVTIPAAGYIDVTDALIDNAGVHTNTDYWTITNVSDPGWNSSAGVCNYGECEFYSRNFKFFQTLALGKGTWEFGVTGFHRAGNHNTNFYAGDSKILIPGVENTVVNSMEEAKTYFDNGNGKVALKFFIENGQNVEVGIDNQDTETDRWTIFRDFTLKYYGPENEILEGDLDGSGEVDVTDLSMLVDYLLGKHVEGLAVDPGTVTLKDVTKLVNTIKKK